MKHKRRRHRRRGRFRRRRFRYRRNDTGKFFKFLLGTIGSVMLISITFGFIPTAFFVGGIAFDYGIKTSHALIGYFFLAIFLVWFGFYKD